MTYPPDGSTETALPFDAPAEAALERLARLACRVLGVSVVIASITTGNRNLLRRCGESPNPEEAGEADILSPWIARGVAEAGGAVVVEDLRARERGMDERTALRAGIIAYAALPLRSAGGEVIGFLCAADDRPRSWSEEEIRTLHDLAAPVVAEMELRREVTERLASVGTLLGGVAHELNNPLTSIKSFAQLMLLDEHRDEDREALLIVQKEADRAAKIVADLRLLARQTREGESDYAAVSLNEGALLQVSDNGPGVVPNAGRVPSLRILVVDDEPGIRRSIARYLARRGHRVDEADDGRSALWQLDRSGAAYDAILADLRMPDLGGDQLFTELKRRGNGLADRLVFITGDAASPEAVRILATSGAPVLLKPFELSRVAQLLEQREWTAAP